MAIARVVRFALRICLLTMGASALRTTATTCDLYFCCLRVSRSIARTADTTRCACPCRAASPAPGLPVQALQTRRIDRREQDAAQGDDGSSSQPQATPHGAASVWTSFRGARAPPSTVDGAPVGGVSGVRNPRPDISASSALRWLCRCGMGVWWRWWWWRMRWEQGGVGGDDCGVVCGCCCCSRVHCPV
jgi:hypothetical protein